MEDTNVETKVEEKKEKVDILNLIDPIEKVFGNQHARVLKDFNNHCLKSMRVVPIVSAMITIESFKVLKEIRSLLIDIKEQDEEVKEVEKKGKRKIDLK